MTKAEQFIRNTWKDTIVTQTEDEGTLLGLPYPYTCPTVNSTFREIYYWDTYFTNKGLILCGMAYQAKNNVDNMLYLVNKYGFMPNGNRTYYLANSQAPFLSQMVKDVYEYYKDPVWLKSAYEILLKEYNGFWMRERITKSGLNRYYYNFFNAKHLDDMYKQAYERIVEVDKIYGDKAKDKEYVVHCFGANCEAGWDCNPRFQGQQVNCNWVDLNSNLYEYEKNFVYFAKELNLAADEWEQKAQNRAELMRKYLWNGKYFTDYNFETGEHCPVISSPSFYPMAVGLCNKAEAESTMGILKDLEFPYGISVCAPNDVPGNYQWDYPNGWPCQQYQVAKALVNYGYIEDAKRIANKYINLADKVFDETGYLWEKYNVQDGNIEATNEYDMPDMMGWSAGVYIAFEEFLKTGKLI